MTTPSGSISLAAEYAAATLADCPAFRTWCGADDAAQARGRIWFDALPPPNDQEEHTLDELQMYRPYVLIFVRSFGRAQVSTGTAYEFGSEGSMGMEFFQDVLAEIKNQAAEISLRFNNAIGSIIDELCDRAGTGGKLAFKRITMDEPCVRTGKDEAATYGDALFVRLTLEWTDN